jgi:GTP-binding protein
MSGREFKVAIIGRPNVGKSTLFNRLVGRKVALVDDLPGVTRDRREGEARLGDLRFTVIDTAGLDEAAPESLAGRMFTQTRAAIADADVSLFVVDVRAGITPVDSHFAKMLRESGKPVLLVANKAEGRAGEGGYLDAFSLGMSDPVPISAEHGEGMGDLREALDEAFDALAEEPADDETDGDPGKPIQIAVVGRPNAGKSTLINRLIGEERLLTGPEAGITRDHRRRLELARPPFPGLRHRRAAPQGPCRGQAREARRRRCTARHPLRRGRRPDARRDRPLREAGPADRRPRRARGPGDRHRPRQVGPRRGPPGEAEGTAREADRLLPQIRGVTLVPVSGLTGEGLDRLMQAAFAAHDIWNRRLSTAQLNRWLATVVEHHPPPAVSGRRIKIRYMTQAKARPPTSSHSARGPRRCPNPGSATWSTRSARTSSFPGRRSGSSSARARTPTRARNGSGRADARLTVASGGDHPPVDAPEAE